MAKTVLAVDDSQTMRDMVKFTLTSAGFEVREAEDGVKGLAALKQGPVDIVITDINMPNMNGIELVKAIRAEPAHKALPVLILTTEADAAKKDEGRAAGATGWIVKPFDPAKLVQVVNKVCP